MFDERNRNRSDLNNDEDYTQATLVFQQGLERMWVLISLKHDDE